MLLWRIEQKCFTVASHIKTIIMNSCNGKPPAKIPDEVAVLYSKDLNIKRLIVQLSMIPDLVKTHQQDPRVQLKHVTSYVTF